MSKIIFTCPVCQASLEVSQSYAGSVETCPQCDQKLTIPSTSSPATTPPPKPAPHTPQKTTPPAPDTGRPTPSPPLPKEKFWKCSISSVIGLSLIAVAAFAYFSSDLDFAQSADTQTNAGVEPLPIISESPAPESPPPPVPISPTPEHPLIIPPAPPASEPEKKFAPPTVATTPAPPLEEEEETSPPPPIRMEEESPLKLPLEALDQFLKAGDWKERSRWVLHPKTVVPKMRRYYESHPSGPIETLEVSYLDTQTAPDSKFRVHLFRVATREVPTGFPVSVEETSDGFKVDWQPFVEFAGRQLEKFFTDDTLESAVLHILLSRSHYFGGGVPALKEKHAFRVQPPFPAPEYFAFISRKSPLVRSDTSAHLLSWNHTSSIIARLKKVKAIGGASYVTIDEVTSYSWRKDTASPPQ